MLTGDLVRVNSRGPQLKPGFVDPDKEALLERAAALIECFKDGVDETRTRAEVNQRVDDLIGDSRDAKLVRGLAKVCLDRSTFEVQAPVDPIELRWQVFSLARERGPIAHEAGMLERTVARDVLEEVAAARELTVEQIEECLYADLQQAHRLQHCGVEDASWLLHRYNVALVQSVLLRSSQVQITVHGAKPPKLRQLFRAIKFHQLLHHASKRKKALHITLDGPSSLFSQSSRYGMQLANFFPSLLLQDARWTLEATVLWTKQRREKKLRLSSEDALVSHYKDRGAYETRLQKWFVERWDALDTDWKRTPARSPINLAGKAVVMPDYTFTKNKKKAHLEIVGFWRRDYLKRRAELLEEYGPGNLILAVSRKLKGGKEALGAFPGEVIEFAEIVPVKKVLTAVERIAR